MSMFQQPPSTGEKIEQAVKWVCKLIGLVVLGVMVLAMAGIAIKATWWVFRWVWASF